MKPKGRPQIHDKNMVRQQFRLTVEQLTWLKEQGNMSETVRKLIDEAMRK